MRAVQLIASMTLVAGLRDFLRFGNPRQLMAYVGLLPCEHSSRPKCREGSITKAGNSVARRMLVEVAWHDLRRSRVSPIIDMHVLAPAVHARRQLQQRPRKRSTGRACAASAAPDHSTRRSWPRKRSALVITDTELRLIASAANIGDSSQPVNAYSTPAASGTPIAL